MTAEKVRENRLRRMATRQGLALVKSRRRDPRAYDFGGYMIVDATTRFIQAGGTPIAYHLNLDAVEARLVGDPATPPTPAGATVSSLVGTPYAAPRHVIRRRKS